MTAASPPIVWSIADRTGVTADGYRAQISAGGWSGRPYVTVTTPIGQKIATTCATLQEAIDAAGEAVTSDRERSDG